MCQAVVPLLNLLLCLLLPLSAFGAAEVAPVTIMLTEGTNVAVTANPGAGDRVVALQGTLYRHTPGTPALTPITGLLDDAWEPDLSPDVRTVVYQGYRDGTSDLWLVGVDGHSFPQQLTSGAFDDREPQFSPDGRRVIFRRTAVATTTCGNST